MRAGGNDQQINYSQSKCQVKLDLLPLLLAVCAIVIALKNSFFT